MSVLGFTSSAMKKSRNSDDFKFSKQKSELQNRRTVIRGGRFFLFITILFFAIGGIIYFAISFLHKERGPSKLVSGDLNNTERYGHAHGGQKDDGPGFDSSGFADEGLDLAFIETLLVDASTVVPHALTAVLPVTPASLHKLESIVLFLLLSPSKLHEIVVTCPEMLLSDVRRIIRQTVSRHSTTSQPELTVHPWLPNMLERAGVYYIASEATTEWILLLNENGLSELSGETVSMLLNPPAIYHSWGPRGVRFVLGSPFCMNLSSKPQVASLLVPPFVVHSSELNSANVFPLQAGSRIPLFGENETSFHQPFSFGGLVIDPSSEKNQNWCYPALQNYLSVQDSAPSVSSNVHELPSLWDSRHRYRRSNDRNSSASIFALIFPSLEELRFFAPVACLLRRNGYSVEVLLHAGDDSEATVGSGDTPRVESSLLSGGCRLDYDRPVPDDRQAPGDLDLSIASATFLWLEALDEPPAIIVSLVDDDSEVSIAVQRIADRDPHPVWIKLPMSDLRHCTWMGTLSLQEWQNWHIPTVDITVITNDRPRSLSRLLSSLSNARYFGDSLMLRINLEQTADDETLQLVDDYHWPHGSVFVHHRVIHGGLLPSVVESWYPHSNDSYGLILEDDVELSPLFYAWVKMSILRYRYGRDSDKSPQLFGISLYQQKIIELRLEGRRPFDAREMFDSFSIPRTMPYLSPVPCSWGAVYFPEHWREFHSYLAARFAEMTMSIDQDVVPDARSNKWTRSWKKFFIELAHLRGYVMLYPNYEDYVSLSTNHLEVGAHVKDSPKEAYEQKRALFLLPLMRLEQPSTGPTVGLMDLPNRTLPAWDRLPILDMFGSLTSEETLQHHGLASRSELMNCSTPPSRMFDVRDLICLQDGVSK